MKKKIPLIIVGLLIIISSYSQGVVNATYLRDPYVGIYKSKYDTLFLSKYNWEMRSVSGLVFKGEWGIGHKSIFIINHNRKLPYHSFNYKWFSQKLCPVGKHTRKQCFRRIN